MATNKQNIGKYIVVGVMVVALVVACGEIVIHKRTYSGIPDLKSTYSNGRDYHMCVVLNSKKIDDRERVAEQIVQMCKDNFFQTIKFSEDVNGFPRSMKISVYHTSEEIGETEPVFQFSYESKGLSSEYDIKSSPDNYELNML